jgi:hypothetical protein
MVPLNPGPAVLMYSIVYTCPGPLGGAVPSNSPPPLFALKMLGYRKAIRNMMPPSIANRMPHASCSFPVLTRPKLRNAILHMHHQIPPFQLINMRARLLMKYTDETLHGLSCILATSIFYIYTYHHSSQYLQDDVQGLPLAAVEEPEVPLEDSVDQLNVLELRQLKEEQDRREDPVDIRVIRLDRVIDSRRV